jgi:ADP-heptose:LPS heptosyltransferase
LTKPEQTGDRPALTAFCERALLRVLGHNSLTAEALPLSSVPQRILVVKVHGMGDSVLIRSLLERFHQLHPGVEIGVLAGAANRDLLTVGSNFHLHPYNQKTLDWSAIFVSLVNIRKRRYQAVINFEQGSLSGAAFIRAAGIPIHAGFIPLSSNAKAALLTHPIRFREEDSMWVSFVRLMQTIDRDFPESVSTCPIPVDEPTRQSMRQWLCARGAGPMVDVAALHLGCAQKRPYRRWPVERFVALAAKLRTFRPNLLIVLTGQPFERELVKAFVEGYSGPVVDATELGSIINTAAMLAECSFLVSNDTGIMHLGAAMGTPTVGIFGPASPRRWGPVGPHAIAVAAAGVPCSPCAETYLLRDPEDCANSDRMCCLREVSVDMVLEAVERVTSRQLHRAQNEPSELSL